VLVEELEVPWDCEQDPWDWVKPPWDWVKLPWDWVKPPWDWVKPPWDCEQVPLPWACEELLPWAFWLSKSDSRDITTSKSKCPTLKCVLSDKA
jgi:hypothetical protein